MPVDLPLAAARYALGLLETEELRNVATHAVISGSPSQSLALLAGALACEPPADLRDLFVAGLREAGVPVPTPLDAADALKRHYAAEVSARRIAPFDGALLIKTVFDKVEPLLPPCRRFVGDCFGIAELLGHFVAFEDVEDGDARRRDLEEGIVRECARIIES